MIQTGMGRCGRGPTSASSLALAMGIRFRQLAIRFSPASWRTAGRGTWPGPGTGEMGWGTGRVMGRGVKARVRDKGTGRGYWLPSQRDLTSRHFVGRKKNPVNPIWNRLGLWV